MGAIKEEKTCCKNSLQVLDNQLKLISTSCSWKTHVCVSRPFSEKRTKKEKKVNIYKHEKENYSPSLRKPKQIEKTMRKRENKIIRPPWVQYELKWYSDSSHILAVQRKRDCHSFMTISNSRKKFEKQQQWNHPLLGESMKRWRNMSGATGVWS